MSDRDPYEYDPHHGERAIAASVERMADTLDQVAIALFMLVEIEFAKSRLRRFPASSPTMESLEDDWRKA